MKNLLKSVLTISLVTVATVVATRAFFTDTETSTGNTFTAGSVDLTVASQAWYNGEQTIADQLHGNWSFDNLSNHLFFNLADVKPGDSGRNVISFKVENNPAWVCASIAVTADDDVTCTDPELQLANDSTCSTQLEVYNGDMRASMSFAWWADDGDGVITTPEEYASLFYRSGARFSDVLALAGGNQVNLTLADSLQNFFADDGDPLAASTPHHLGIAWCMGDMDISDTPDSNGEYAVICDGSTLNNAAQTDSMRATLSFTAQQQRHQSTFRCPDSFKPGPSSEPAPDPSSGL